MDAEFRRAGGHADCKESRMEKIDVGIEAMTCEGCRRAVKFKDVKAALGKCPQCLKESYRVTFCKVYSSRESVSGGNLATGVALGMAFGTLAATSAAQGNQSMSTTNYELAGVHGPALVALMEKPGAEIMEWISATRKAAAVANLAPNQGLCKQCGEIFKKALAGHTREGYCSPICKRQFEKAGAPAIAPVEDAIHMPCPWCKVKLKLKAEAKGKRIECPRCKRAFKA